MYCMKCGKEAKESNVFCEDCLQIMADQPVKPGTAVQIPQRPASPLAKKPVGRKKALPPEEQVVHLQKSIRMLILAVMVLVVALFTSIGLHLRTISIHAEQDSIGKNYSTISPTETK